MIILNRLSIKAKMLSLVSLLLVMMTSIAGFGYFKLQQIGTELHGIITEDIPLTEIATDLTSKQFEAALLLERAIQTIGLTSNTSLSINDIHNKTLRINKTIGLEITEAEVLLNKMISHAMSARLKQEEEYLKDSLIKLKEEQLEYERLTDKFLTSIENDNLISAQGQLSELQKKQQVLLNHLESFLVGIEKLTEDALLLAEEHEISALNGMAVIGMISFVLGGLLSYWYTIAMTRPLRKAVEAANKMAKGDLTVSLQSSGKDEIALLLNSMHDMARNLESTIYQVLRSSNEIASTAEEMATTAEQAKTTITTQHLNTDQVTIAMNEMAITIQQIADNTSTAAMETENAQQQVSNGHGAVSDNLTNIHSLTEQVNIAALDIASAREQSEAITEFVGDINDIAEQTNLLALNASIEAARAGEQGRGFSVVADEVRKLATKTQSTTSEIQQFVDNLQNQTLNASNSIEKTSLMMNSSSEKAEYCQKTLESINTLIEELNLKNIEIATICEQQSAAAEEINRSMVAIGDSGIEVQSGSEQSAIASVGMSQLALKLRETMGQFKLSEIY